MSQTSHRNITTPTLRQTSTRDNSTNMTAIEDAIAATKLSKEGASFLYRKVANQFAVNRTTVRG
jgi:hypothetical protein